MSNRTGTVVALTTALAFNGRTLNGVEFGILANVLGDSFAVKSGSIRKDGARGKPAVIWTLSDNSPVTVTEVSAVNAVATVEAEAEDATTVDDEVVEQRDESADAADVFATEL